MRLRSAPCASAGERQEETLLAAEAADHDIGLAFQRQKVASCATSNPARSAMLSVWTCLPLTQSPASGQFGVHLRN